jgi:putative addiction module component (TIGR02574 family)
MTADLDQVLQAALALPDDDRLVLIEALLAASAPDEGLPFDRSWLPTVRERLAAYDAGQTRAYTWAEVKERARRGPAGNG